MIKNIAFKGSLIINKQASSTKRSNTLLSQSTTQLVTTKEHDNKFVQEFLNKLDKGFKNPVPLYLHPQEPVKAPYVGSCDYHNSLVVEVVHKDVQKRDWSFPSYTNLRLKLDKNDEAVLQITNGKLNKKTSRFEALERECKVKLSELSDNLKNTLTELHNTAKHKFSYTWADERVAKLAEVLKKHKV